MLHRVIAVALGAALLVPAVAAAADAGMYMKPADVKYGDVPPNLPKGGKLGVLAGDPGKQGPFTIRLQMPANYKIPPHWHTTDEDVTVISGSVYLGEGDKMDMKAAHEVKAGGFHHIPGKVHHYAFTKSASVVQINAMGPFDITYIDPNDDPSKAAAPAAAPKKDAGKAPAKDGMKK